jgi:hypothetical protein
MGLNCQQNHLVTALGRLTALNPIFPALQHAFGERFQNMVVGK